MRTNLATELLPQLRREWLADSGAKVARFQPLFPSVLTNGPPLAVGTDFVDGTAFAVGCLTEPSEAAMDLLRSAYGTSMSTDN